MVEYYVLIINNSNSLFSLTAQYLRAENIEIVLTIIQNSFQYISDGFDFLLISFLNIFDNNRKQFL